MDARPRRIVGIDWGTTHRRAYLLDGDGSLLATRHDEQGTLATHGNFPAALAALLAGWRDLLADCDPLILMAGMVGSALGWHEVPYLPAALPASADLCVIDATTCIVPGCLWRAPDGTPDVMRGEETQLLGASLLGHGDGWHVLPGTHSKWVFLDDGKIKMLRTYMTGELFALVRQQGTLAALMRDDDASPAAFARGVAAARDGAMAHALFTCRARVVSGDWPAGDAASYVSGLLIGAEWHDILALSPSRPLHVGLIGSPALAQRHQVAASLLGCTVTVIDPDQAFIAALRALAPHGCAS
jgi:2-dehydro-3-deoxygalactonokinase